MADTLFTADGCQACTALKQMAASQGLRLPPERNIDHDRAAHVEVSRMGARGVPFAVINGQTFTGPREILAALTVQQRMRR